MTDGAGRDRKVVSSAPSDRSGARRVASRDVVRLTATWPADLSVDSSARVVLGSPATVMWAADPSGLCDSSARVMLGSVATVEVRGCTGGPRGGGCGSLFK